MTQVQRERLREFSQKMRDEGSAGFADGPWDDAEIEGDDRPSARQRQKKNWAMNSSRRARQRTLGDRVLTWLAILALITLIAGVGGTWLSYQPEPEITVTRTDRLNRTPSLERVASRLTRMEKRLSYILEPYIRMLNNLSGELDDTQKQLIEHIRDTEQQLATTTGFVNRLENVDQRLAAADERMDTLSAMLAALVDGNPESVPRTDQPAATAGSPGTGETWQAAPLPAQDKIPGLQPVQRPEVPASSAGEKPAPTEPETSTLAAQQPAPEVPTSSQAGSTGKPAGTAADPAPGPKPEIPVPAAQQPAAADPAGSRTEAAEKPVETTPEPVQETKSEPAAPVAAGIAAGSANGNWVINVASYTNERVARRKLAQMQQQGVDVELVTAEVNGKTIHRARVFGFASRRDAETHAAGIRAKLGIKETWITKR